MSTKIIEKINEMQESIEDLEEEINNFDIFILPPNTLNSKKLSFDFIINTRSFMEMKMDIIQEYFNLIQNKTVDGDSF